MNDTTPGLAPVPPARLRNISKQPAKVSLIIPAGDELEVSADVAEQLTVATDAIRPADYERVLPVAEEPAEEAKPRKRSARKPAEA